MNGIKGYVRLVWGFRSLGVWAWLWSQVLAVAMRSWSEDSYGKRVALGQFDAMRSVRQSPSGVAMFCLRTGKEASRFAATQVICGSFSSRSRTKLICVGLEK